MLCGAAHCTKWKMPYKGFQQPLHPLCLIEDFNNQWPIGGTQETNVVCSTAHCIMCSMENVVRRISVVDAVVADAVAGNAGAAADMVGDVMVPAVFTAVPSDVTPPKSLAAHFFLFAAVHSTMSYRGFQQTTRPLVAVVITNVVCSCSVENVLKRISTTSPLVTLWPCLLLCVRVTNAVALW